MKKSSTLRKLITSDKILFRPGVGIAIHALMVEAAGFKVVNVSGAQTAAHILGLPDAGLLTMTELVENVRRIAAVVNIPVIADCDTGFGNAINVRRTVREIIGAGAAGLFFEDQVAPKRCGFVRGKEIISIEEATLKIQAAADVRDSIDPDFVLIARTDARGAYGGGIDEAIRRGNAYREAGADMIYVEALLSEAEIKTVAKAVGQPFTCTFHGPAPTLEQLQEWGVSMTGGAMVPSVGLMAVWDLLLKMHREGIAPYHDMIEKTQQHPLGGFGFFDLTGFPRVQELEQQFLHQPSQDRLEGSIGEYDPRVGSRGFAGKHKFSL